MTLTARDYYLIRKNIIEMLYDRSEQATERFHFDRGSLDLFYLIPFEAIDALFTSATERQMLNLEFKNDFEKIAVIFVDDTRDLEKRLVKYRRAYLLEDTDTLIAVLCTKGKPEFMPPKNHRDEVFWFKQLTFNVSNHSLVPKHELLHPIIKNELKELYFLNSIHQLPTILNDDPVAKWYGMKPGDICKITRENPNVGQSIIYRLVVESV